MGGGVYYNVCTSSSTDIIRTEKRILVNSRMNGKYQTVSPGTLNLGPLLPIVEADFNLENNCLEILHAICSRSDLLDLVLMAYDWDLLAGSSFMEEEAIELGIPENGASSLWIK